MAEATKKKRHRSVSQLLSYSQCGEAYRLERRTDAPRRPAGWFMHGHAVHHALEEWERSGRTISEADLEELFLTSYRNAVNEELERTDLEQWMTGGNKKPETDLTDREEIGWWQIQDYIQFAREQDEFWGVLEVEKEFRIELNGVEILGYIDQIVRDKFTGELIGRDLKSGTKVPPTPVQLAIYRYAMQLLYPEATIAEAFEWVKLGRPGSRTGKTPPKRVELIAEDLTEWPPERIARWLVDMDRSETQGIYLPSPTSDCDRVCGVAQWCLVKGWHLDSVKQYAESYFQESISLRVVEEAKA